MRFERFVSIVSLGIGAIMGYCTLNVVLDFTWFSIPAAAIGGFVTYKAFENAVFWWKLCGEDDGIL
jgi:hypothetical protein